MAQHMLALAAFFSLQAAFVSSAGVKSPGTANYTLTFRALWKLDRHPNTPLPLGAHFSALVGCSHGADYVMWRERAKATPGVELVAETGGTSTLVNEINAQITAKKAWKQILASGTGAEGVLTGIRVQVSSNFSKVSLISMLAPSPDWFVGVDSLDMCDNGTWRESWNVTMSPPWDAGTEEGLQFSLANSASDPHVDIFQITNTMDGAFKNNEPIKSLAEFLFKSDATSIMPMDKSTSTTPMDKSTSTMPMDKSPGVPTESSVGKVSVSFLALMSAASIRALLFKVL